MAPRGTLWGSFCVVVTLSVIETIWTKFGQNLGFSLRNSVSLSPGPAVKSLGLWSPNRYEIELLKEVLIIDFGQGAAKISEVKVGGQKNICRAAGFEPMRVGSAALADIFFVLQL